MALTLPKLYMSAMIAKGTAGKSTASLVPRITSWRLAKNCLSILNLIFDTSIGSDFLRKIDVDDTFCGVVRPLWWCSFSTIKPLESPFSISILYTIKREAPVVIILCKNEWESPRPESTLLSLWYYSGKLYIGQACCRLKHSRHCCI
jgi:hypothetical protein